MFIDWFIVGVLAVGGFIGFQSGQEHNRLKNQSIKIQKVEPELYGPDAHLKIMKVCARQCRLSKVKFKSYNFSDGECICGGKR